MKKRIKTEEEKKEIFKKIIHEFQMSDDGSEVIVWNESVKTYSDFDGGEILISKTNNLIKLLNEAKSKSEDEFKTLMKRDIEDDIWYIV